MKKHMVLGCYRFVGYHLCDYLLESGEEVIGVDCTADLVGDEMEEKALSFGRNANFTYHRLADCEFEINADWNIHIPYYDFQKCPKDVFVKINEIIERSHHESCEVIELYPNEVQVVEEVGKIKLLSPTIYGPWQPKGELIRSLLSDEDFSKEKDLFDDAIYVRDLVEEWPKILNLQAGVYELFTDLENHLTTCLANTNNQKEVTLLPRRNTNHIKYEIHVKTKPEDGIRKQKKHMDIQEKLQEWKKK